MNVLTLVLFLIGMSLFGSIAFVAGSFFGYNQARGELSNLNRLLVEVQADRDARAGEIPTDPETGEHNFNGLESTRRSRHGATPPGATSSTRETDRKAA